jgi:hypothetical protein
MNAHSIVSALLEVLGPSAEEVQEIVNIIKAGGDMQALNAQLVPRGIAFDYHETFRAHPGAIGAFDGETMMVLLNPASLAPYVRNRVPWETVIAHELTHREQMSRAQDAGADPGKITGNKLAKFTRPGGGIDTDKYLSDPLELQALARNAVDAASAKGHDVGKAMRKGNLGGYAPLPPGDQKRFGKYAYQYAQDRKPKQDEA